MKRLIFAGLVLAASLSADVLVEAKASYFMPKDERFRKIYSQAGIYGLEASFKTWKNLYPWISTSLFVKGGHSLGSHDLTRMWFVPTGIGLKYLFPVQRVDFYIGAGGLVTFLHTRDHSEFVIRSNNRWGGGGIVKAGMLWNSFHKFFVDLFADYSFHWVPAESHSSVVPHTANLKGWSVGAGLGYRFGPRPSDERCCEEY